MIRDINEMIESLPSEDKGKISDGYHTFDELYEHRITLYISLCKAHYGWILPIWKSKKHHDGSSFEGWFILGIGKDKGEQISYHLPISKWDDCDFDELEFAPEWDGHTSADVLERIKRL